MAKVRWTISLLLLAIGLTQAQKDQFELQVKCGANFQEDWKAIPINLEKDSDCTWTIQKPDSRTIRLIFSDYKFQPSSDCSQENITVYDGDSSSSPSLGVVCKDSQGSGIFESSSNSLTFQISTDSVEFARSIYAFYYYFSPEDASQQCGGTLTGPSGAFTSPNYPGFHQPFTYCLWHIEVDPKSTIRIDFSEIFLEIDSACRFDFIALYDGPSTSSPLIEEVCGRTKGVYESSSNSLTMVLSTDYANSYRGFSAKYTAERNITLTCAEDYMTVIIKQSYLDWMGYEAEELELLNSSCRADSFNPVEFNVPLNGCGTFKQVTEDHTITYTNVISAFPPGLVITRQKKVQIIVKCEMNSNSTVEIMYVTEDDTIVTESSFGQYNVDIHFYKSEDFDEPVVESPYFVDLNQTLYTQIALHSSDPNLEVFIDSCIASPMPNFTAPVYDLIRYGCEKDDTCHIYQLHNQYGRFKFSAFKFLKEKPSVYLQCKVVVCDSNDKESRCNEGCISRHKRDLSSHSRTINAVVGPIRLKSYYDVMGRSDSSNTDQGEAAQGSSTFLIATVVLAVNSVILALVALKSYWNKNSGYRYQKLPSL